MQAILEMDLPALFDFVSSLDRDRRDQVLAELATHDPDRTASLRKLLARDGGDLGLSTPQGAVLASGRLLLNQTPEGIAGNYRLLERIGHGGMGSVYRGERVDGDVQHRVAVKFAHALVDNDYGRAAIRREAELLARLNHPNIAHFLDFGQTASGQPYVISEFVDGLPLSAYCRQQALDLRQRLQLFRKVLEGVAHAHGQLILHRDLKPGNVLVTEDGEAKIIDFGVSRALTPGEDAAPVTRAEQRPLTPDYASPEQLAGEAMSMASDVYSLGVMLYELACGQRPFNLRGMASDEIVATVHSRLPRAPSTRVPATGSSVLAGSSASRRRLWRDLDTIILKALAREPALRYPTVREFHADILRALHNRPVHARPRTWRYRLGKFLQRNPVPVAAGTVAVLMGLLTITGLSIQQRRLSLERDHAVTEGKIAASVQNFLVELFTAANIFASPGRQVTARDLLVDAGTRVAAELGNAPRAKARVLLSLARAYNSLGEYRQASRLYLQAHDLWSGPLQDRINTAPCAPCPATKSIPGTDNGRNSA